MRMNPTSLPATLVASRLRGDELWRASLAKIVNRQNREAARR